MEIVNNEKKKVFYFKLQINSVNLLSFKKFIFKNMVYDIVLMGIDDDMDLNKLLVFVVYYYVDMDLK